MTSEEAVRQHLIDRLQNHDQEGAERLDGGLDKAFLERRLGGLDSWKDGWKKWIWIVAFTLGLAMLSVPVASEVGVGVLGGHRLLFWPHRYYQPVASQENDLRNPGGNGRSGARSE
jgi:hypothetical protein